MGNGMKSGSGEDPFEGIEAGGDDAEAGEEPTTDATDEAADAAVEPETVDRNESPGGTSDNSGNGGVSGLPWKYSRSNAKDGREMVQFFLQEETQTTEDVAQSELADRLNEDVLRLDLREAAYQVALEQHLDDVANRLREWGYDPE